MSLLREIQTNIQVPVFLLVKKLNIDVRYFIEHIEKGIKEVNNNNYTTNVLGKMTAWNYFCKNQKFETTILCEAVDTVENKIKNLDRCRLTNAWGIKHEMGEKTQKHDHKKDVFSGIVYLNKSDQALHFDEIDQKIDPEEGLLILFSSILKHYTFRNTSNKAKYAIAFNFGHILNGNE
jgi:hypothetical protein